MKGSHLYCLAILTVILLAACTSSVKKTASKKHLAAPDSIGVRLQLVTTALKNPVEMNVAPDSTHRMFITDISGMIWILTKDSILPVPFLKMDKVVGPQKKGSFTGAIYSVAFHPQFATNRKFYVCYVAPSKLKRSASKLVVAEFKASSANPNVADLKSRRSIIELEGKNSMGNGAEIRFGPDSYLYISIGDDKGGDSTYQYHAQDLSSLSGKLLRIDINKTPYAIPADNPFVSDKKARPEIWAYGFRKFWRYSFDPASGLLIGGDVGENREEEIDIVTKGANYGWPVREGDSSFEKGNGATEHLFTAPINTYNHLTGICIIGGSFYYGKAIPQLNNHYVFGDLSGSMYALIKGDQGKWVRQPLKIFNKPSGSFLIYGFAQDTQQELYIMGTSNGELSGRGALYKIIKM